MHVIVIKNYFLIRLLLVTNLDYSSPKFAINQVGWATTVSTYVPSLEPQPDFSENIDNQDHIIMGGTAHKLNRSENQIMMS